MKAEKLLEKFNGRQKDILEIAMHNVDYKEITNDNIHEIELDVHDQVRDDVLTGERSGLSEELWEDYREVFRYLNALKENEEVRKKKAYEFVKQEYATIQEMVDDMISKGNKAPDIVEYAYRQEDAFISVAGMGNGLTDSEVMELCKDLDITFEGMNWEEIECVGE